MGIRFLGPDGVIDASLDHHLDYQKNGLVTLSFSVPRGYPYYQCFAEELQVEHRGQKYIIKQFSEQNMGSDFLAELDLDELKDRVFAPSFESHTVTLGETLLAALVGTNWSAVGTDLVSIKRSISLPDCTPYDIAMECQSVFGVTYSFDTKNKTIKILKPENEQEKNLYITDQLNLRRIDLQGDSYDLVTRLYPYGKKDEETGTSLDIRAVNDGVEYLEDRSYCDKVIAAVWRDERYTDPQSLKNDALEKLKKLAHPVRSYELDVADLAKIDPSYKELAISLHDKVTLIDRRRRTRETHQVVAYRDYPDEPERNVITLSNVPTKIQGQIKETIQQVSDVVIREKERVNEIKRDLDATSSRVAETYTKGETDAILESQITQAKDVIRTEVSQTYVTGEELQREKSEIEQQLGQITLSTQKTGGGNLVLGSSGRMGLDDWDVEGAVACDTSTETYNATSAGGGFLLGKNVEGTAGRMAQRFKTVVGGQYAWYFRFHVEGGLHTEAQASISGNKVELSGENWQEVSGFFHAEREEAEIAFSVNEGRLWVADIMVAEGISCTAWQQAQNEIDAGGVKISSRGIDITRENDPFQASLDNQQVRFRNNDTGEDVAYFNKDSGRIRQLSALGEFTVQRPDDISGALRVIPVAGGAFFVIND